MGSQSVLVYATSNEVISSNGRVKGRLVTDKDTAIANGSDQITFTLSGEVDYDSNGTFETPYLASSEPVQYTVTGGLSENTFTIVITAEDCCCSDADPNTFDACTENPPVNTGVSKVTLKSSVPGQKTITVTYASYNPSTKLVIAVDVIFTAPATPSPTPTPTSTPQASAPPENPSQDVPAVPVPESLKVGNTQFAADKITQNKIKQGEKLVFSGKTIPNAKVTLYIYSDPITKETTSDKDGNWSVTLDQTLSVGEHRIEAIVTDPITGKSSEKKEIAKFTVIKTATSPSPTISTSPIPTGSQILINALKTPYGIGAIITLVGLVGVGGFILVRNLKKKPVVKKEEENSEKEDEKVEIEEKKE